MKRTRTYKPPDIIGPVILACDPSFTAWGYAIINNDIIRETGCIKTAPEAKKRRIREGDDRVRRTSEIISTLLEIIDQNEVNLIVSELPHGSQNAKAAVMIGIVVGVLQGISLSKDISIEWYSENDAKKCLLKKVSCTKQEIINAIDKLYEVHWTDTKYKDEAVADAIAIYHVAKQQSALIKYLNK